MIILRIASAANKHNGIVKLISICWERQAVECHAEMMLLERGTKEHFLLMIAATLMQINGL
jgi:hypothetical protein